MANKYKVNKRFFKEWSRKMAYVLGFIVADGYVCEKTKRIDIQGELQPLNTIRKIMKSTHPVVFMKKRNRHRLAINGKALIKDLVKLGVRQKKSLTVEFPKVPAKYLSHFIRGLWDGDGCIHYAKRRNSLHVLLTTGSKKLAEQTKKRIIKNGFKVGKISRQVNTFFVRLSETFAKDFLNWMYRYSQDMRLERKYLIFKKGGIL